MLSCEKNHKYHASPVQVNLVLVPGTDFLAESLGSFKWLIASLAGCAMCCFL